jgi:DNA processing protein
MPVDVRTILMLAEIPGIGPQRLKALLNHFTDPRSILSASVRELASVGGMDRRSAGAIAQFNAGSGGEEIARRVDQQLAELDRVGGRVVTLHDEEYPSNLRRIYDPPPLLFVRGSLSERDDLGIAVVGTRSPTEYGVALAAQLAGDLAAGGLTIISGLARGVDTAAHRAALAASSRTLAVIGSGIDVIYPPENASIAERIVESGALLSECGMGARPEAANFPRRNRIISGIAIATLVVETAIDGGAMITANMAFDQDRELFCVPSPVHAGRKSGTNFLIKQGKAMLVESAEDILAELAPRLRTLSRHPPLEPPQAELTFFERQVYDVLEDTPMHIDLIIERSRSRTSDVLVQLLSLEFKGVIHQLPGKMFARV